MQDQNKPTAASIADTDESAAPAQVTDAANDAETVEVMPGPEELLRKAELAAQEHHDAWLRARAEAENIRKRAQIEIANAQKYALESFVGELLPVRDSLEAALAAPNASIESLKAGVELTLRQVTSAFDKINLKEINPLGEKLDPHLHQAMNLVDSKEPANTVVAVLQKGYQLHDRVVRPALVSVSRPQDA